jgi:hypothetical protein
MNAAILDARPGLLPGTDLRDRAMSDFVRLFALDRLPAGRRLVCHWRRAADGLLAAIWEPEVGPVPQR